MSPTAKIFWSDLWYDVKSVLIASSGGIAVILWILGYALLPESVMLWILGLLAGAGLVFLGGLTVYSIVRSLRSRWRQAEVKAVNRRLS